jgi:hypothetical protein
MIDMVEKVISRKGNIQKPKSVVGDGGNGLQLPEGGDLTE